MDDQSCVGRNATPRELAEWQQKDADFLHWFRSWAAVDPLGEILYLQELGRRVEAHRRDEARRRWDEYRRLGPLGKLRMLDGIMEGGTNG